MPRRQPEKGEDLQKKGKHLIFIPNGIVHLIAEVGADKVPIYTYSIVIDGVPETSVKIGDGVSLSATPYINGSVTTGATFEWKSSNTHIATVDGIGNVTFVSTGNVSIMCTWVEKDISKSTSVINVISSDVSPIPMESWSMNISGNTALRIGYARTYTINTLLNGVETYLDGVEYEIINKTTNIKFVKEVFDTVTNKLTLQVDDDRFLDESFTIRAYHTERGISDTIDIEIVGIFS